MDPQGPDLRPTPAQGLGRNACSSADVLAISAAPGTGGIGTVNVMGGSLSSSVGETVGAGDGVGTLNITSGGTVTSGVNLIIGNAAQAVPGGPISGPQGTGTVLVSGSGSNGNPSTLTVATNMTVGQYGHGTLTVQDGGVVNAPGGIFVATQGIVATGASATGGPW
jgi:fibronectin-binding autotransporter adhesin